MTRPSATSASMLLLTIMLGTSIAWAQAAALPAEQMSPAGVFLHPVGLHTRKDFDRMKANVAAGEHPWIDSWNALIVHPKARNTYKAAPLADMGGNRQRASAD